MIKLTKHQLPDNQTVIKIDGRLDAESLKELRRLLDSLTRPDAITIDLAGLKSIDQVGRKLLIGLRGGGCRLRGGSLYINRLLEEV